MPAFFANRSLSRGDLTLFLRNAQGLPQDGYDVRWTVYTKDGMAASGHGVPASRAGTGEYYAPWGCAKVGGCYTVKWEYSASPGLAREHWCQDFFVLESSGCCVSVCCSRAPASSTSTIDCGAFFLGQPLDEDDLVLKVVDDDGLPSQAFLVLYSIYDCCGRAVLLRGQALPGSAVGDYYAPWTASALGTMTVKWEWMLEQDSPMESVCSDFSVVNPPALFSNCGGDVSNFNHCPPGTPPQVIVVNGCCDDTVVPRTVVLPSQTLPLGEAFTNQAAFVIPSGVRHVAFYVKYAYGVPGGYPIVRLMWGNGTEETQSSIINVTFASFGAKMAANQLRLNDLIGPTPDTSDPVSFLVESTVPGGSSTVRLLIAEGGVPGVPGTAEITLTGSSG